MKLGAVAIDYDGIIARPTARSTRLCVLRLPSCGLRGLSVILLTGRRLDDLRSVAGNLGCFNAVVAENGAVLYFPESGRQALIGHALSMNDRAPWDRRCSRHAGAMVVSAAQRRHVG